MDPLTHLMGGAVVAHALSGTTSVPEPTLTLACMATAVVPDLDFFSRKLPGAAFLRMHHGFSHSLAGFILQCGVLTTSAYFFLKIPGLPFGEASFTALLVPVFLSLLSHGFLDWVMHNNGLPFLWPLTRRRYAQPLILGVNPYTISRNCSKKKFSSCFGCQFRGSLRNPIAWILTLGGAIGLIMYPYRLSIGYITLFISAVYLVFSYILRERARTAVLRLDPLFAESDAYPGRARPNFWLFVREFPDGAARVVLAESFSMAVVRDWKFTPPLISPFVETHTSRIKSDLDIAVKHIYPEVQYRDGGITHINFRDLSCMYAEPVELCSVKVELDESGEIISEVYQGAW
jgi:membrane-bound metal-dependent hydrolase YbcI (DUF457 family)